MGFTRCRRKPARTGCSCGDSAAIARAVSCGVCIVILAAGGGAVWQRLRRDWQARALGPPAGDPANALVNCLRSDHSLENIPLVDIATLYHRK